MIGQTGYLKNNNRNHLKNRKQLELFFTISSSF